MPDAQITLERDGNVTTVRLICWPELPMSGHAETLETYAVYDRTDPDAISTAAAIAYDIDAIRADDLWEDFDIDPEIADYR